MTSSGLAILWSATLIVAALFVWVRRRNHAIGREASPGESSMETGVASRLSLSAESVRGPVAALLAGGVGLFLLGQASYADADWQRPWMLGLMGIGGAAFLLGGQLAVRRRAPTWLLSLSGRLTDLLRVSAPQLILLGFAPCLALMAGMAAGEVLQARHPLVSLAAWLAGILCVIVGGLPQGERPRPAFNRLAFLGLSLLFMVALALRATATEQLPANFSGDEGSAGMVALMFVEGEADNLFTVGWFSFPSLYFAIPGLGIAILGRTVEALRVSSAVGGALAVVAVYFLARHMFDRLTGVLAAVYMAASHYHIHMSRIGLNNVWDSLFSAAAVLGLWYGWKTGKRAGYLLGGLALGLGQYFYASIRALPLLFLAWAAIALWRERRQIRRRLPDLALAALAALVIVLPLLVFFARHPDEFNAPLNRVSIVRTLAASRAGWSPEEAVALLADNILQTALGFTQEPLRLLYAPGRPLLLPGAATLFLLGLLWAFTHFDLRYLLLTLPLLGVILIGALGSDSPASQRYIVAMPMVAVLVAVPLGLVGRWLGDLWPERRRLLGAGVLALMLWLALADINYYFFHAFDSYVLGGGNTVVATEVAHYLRDHETPQQRVYFFGFPRMGYYSLKTIPYLAPGMTGIDVLEKLTAEPEWSLTGATIFIFLPERLGELEFVRATYPGGRYREFYSGQGEMLFAAYETDGRQMR